MAIAQSLLEIVVQEGKLHQMEKVNVIRLQVGALAAVVPESLMFCFEVLSKDTIASGATLAIETIPVVARCHACNIHFEVRDHMYLCPQCDEPVLDLMSGRELSVTSIEGETGESDGTD